MCVHFFRVCSKPYLLFCAEYWFVWWQICFTSSFKFAVSSNISNGLAFSGNSNNTFTSSLNFFALTNLVVRFHFNSAIFFSSSLAHGSSISKTSPSAWTAASDVTRWWLSSLFARIGSSAVYSVSKSSKICSVSLSVSLSVFSSHWKPFLLVFQHFN